MITGIIISIILITIFAYSFPVSITVALDLLNNKTAVKIRLFNLISFRFVLLKYKQNKNVLKWKYAKTSINNLKNSVIFSLKELGFYSQISALSDAFLPVMFYLSLNNICKVVSRVIMDNFRCKIINGLSLDTASENLKVGLKCIISVSLADIIISAISYYLRQGRKV